MRNLNSEIAMIFCFCSIFIAASKAVADTALQNMPYVVSGSATITSDYVFRGISQSDGRPAAQASLSIGGSSGPYAGAWISNVGFNDGRQAQAEVDYAAGFKWPWGNALNDVGLIFYSYPGAAGSLDYNYIEAKMATALPAGPFNLTGALFISPDFFAGSGTSLYLNGGASLPLVDNKISFNAAIGHQFIKDDDAFGISSYTDWSAGATYNWEKFSLSLAYDNTNISKGQCRDACAGRFVATISRSFP